jgi:hypothetical protein
MRVFGRDETTVMVCEESPALRNIGREKSRNHGIRVTRNAVSVALAQHSTPYQLYLVDLWRFWVGRSDLFCD